MTMVLECLLLAGGCLSLALGSILVLPWLGTLGGDVAFFSTIVALELATRVFTLGVRIFWSWG